MNMIQQNINALQQKFEVTPIDIKKDAFHKVGPMKFKISQYTIQGVGNLSILEGSALLGLMKMDTLIITPSLKDAPLFSYDRIYAMGNDTLIVEIYDTLLNKNAAYNKNFDAMMRVKESFGSDFDHVVGKHWYDSIKLPISFSKKGKKVSSKFDMMYLEMFGHYINMLMDVNDCFPSQKKEKSKVYVDGLFENGGPSTDQFVKAIGKEEAMRLFESIIFDVKG